MNKTEFVNAIMEKATEINETKVTKKDTETFLKAFEDVVTETLAKNEKIQLVGFGTFDVTERAARMGRNPQTGAEIPIPASKAPRFKAGKSLKDAVNV